MNALVRRVLLLVVAVALVAIVAAGRPLGPATGADDGSVEQLAAEAVADNQGCINSFDALIDAAMVRATPDRPGMSDAGVFVGVADDVPRAFDGTLLGKDTTGLWVLRGSGDSINALHLVAFDLPSGRSVWVIAGGMSRGDCQVWKSTDPT